MVVHKHFRKNDMASIPRILAVDSTDQVASILRGAMTLLDRRFILVEVPNAEDALIELQNTEVDLLITAYALPDLNGLDLAARAVRESAGTRIIVLAAANDPVVEPEKLENIPYTYLVRPVGEQFWRALRMGLDGVAAVAAQEGDTQAQHSLDLGPMPDIDERALRDHLMPMMRDTAALGAFIADRMGRVIFTQGITGYFDIGLCAAVLAPNFAHTVDLRGLLGGNAATLQYFDGENYDIFAMALGLHYFVVLIFDGTKRPAFGPVTNFGRKEADLILEKIGPDVAWSFRRPVQQLMTQTMPALSMDMAAVLPEVPAPVEETPVIPEGPLVQLEPVEDLDLDRIFSQNVDETAFDDLFSDDDIAQDNIFVSGDNNVSFNEAMNMGILDE